MRSEWKSLGVQLHHIFGLPISRPCQIILFIIADSTDDFNPSMPYIGRIANMRSGNVARDLKTLASLNYIIRNGTDSKGRTKWLINIETIRPLISHLTIYPPDRASINVSLTERAPSISQREPPLSVRESKPLKNPKINPKEEDAREALPPPPSHNDNALKLDAQTPKDPEEKPAKKKTKSKPSQKRKITTWGHDHEFSQIFTLLCSLKPYKAIFDVPTDTKTISAHMANQNWNIAQMTYIVRLFVTKSIGSEDRIKSPRRMLATYVGNGEKYNYAELEKLKPFQGEYI